MAAPKSLTERLEAIINLPGATPVKGQLIKLLRSVKLLEGGHATRQKEAKIATLKAENEKLKIELQAVQAQIEQYQAEQAGRQKKERDIPPIQFQILAHLPSESECNWRRIDEISRAVKIRVDEAEVYINGLKKLGLAAFHPHEPGGGGWHRTTEGNMLVVAKRWAGEEDQEASRKYPDLPAIQHEALLMMVGEDEGINERDIAKRLGKSLALTQHNLSLLREADMATDGEEGDYGTGRTWVLLRKGEKYLAERNLL